MAIDVHAEALVDLREYARLRPPGRNRRPMHLSTAYRHAMNGVRGVRLETVRVGSTLYTSREAIQRFVDRLSAPAEVVALGSRVVVQADDLGLSAAKIFG